MDGVPSINDIFDAIPYDGELQGIPDQAAVCTCQGPCTCGTCQHGEEDQPEDADTVAAEVEQFLSEVAKIPEDEIPADDE